MKKRRWKHGFLNLFAALGLILPLGACVHQPPPEPGCPRTDVPSGPNAECDPDIVYFERDVLPILRSKCAIPGCHDAGTAEEDVQLDSYENVVNTGEVSACNPGDSKIYEMITEEDPEDRMPPEGQTPLTSAEIDLITLWIDQGALNLVCRNDCDTTNVTFSGSVAPLIQSTCQGCHSGPSPQGGISLTNYAEIAAQANNGALYGAVHGLPGYTQMPLGSSLPQCQRDIISIWIADGAPNN